MSFVLQTRERIAGELEDARTQVGGLWARETSLRWPWQRNLRRQYSFARLRAEGKVDGLKLALHVLDGQP